MAVIDVKGVSKTFYSSGSILKAIKDISLSVNRGEFVSIVGPSGCGKSTLFNIISGLQLPDSGEIRINGENVTGKKGKVAYMPQKDLLFPWRTIIDNVVLGSEIQGIPVKQTRKEALSLMPLFGLQGFEHSYPSELSGGMRQRAALLRTFLCKKDIMLLDEPFGRLDEITKSKMQKWLLDVWERFQTSILFITHDIEEAVFLSDRVYVFSDRPAVVNAEIKVNLSRPRSQDVINHPEFLNIKRRLWKALKESI